MPEKEREQKLMLTQLAGNAPSVGGSSPKKAVSYGRLTLVAQALKVSARIARNLEAKPTKTASGGNALRAVSTTTLFQAARTNARIVAESTIGITTSGDG